MKHMQQKDHEKAKFLQGLEITAVPPAVEARLRQVYAELPGDVPQTYAGPMAELDGYEEVLPVKVTPLQRTLKVAAGACGAMAAAMVLLVGLNTVNPEFTESLPGLGGLFAQVNGKNPLGQNLDTYDDLEQVSQVAISDMDSGYQLTVDEAFCDGEYVYFTLEMECPEEAAKYKVIYPYEYAQSFSRPYTAAASEYTDGSRDVKFYINGQETKAKGRVSDIGSPQEGTMGFAYTLPAPEQAEDGEKLQISLHVDSLCGLYEDSYDTGTMDLIPVGFSTEFEVTVNTTHNHINVGEGQDNGVSVKEVESTPGYIKIKIESPMWGYEQEEVYSFGLVKGIPSECYLYTEDGQELARNSEFWEYDPKLEGPTQEEGPVYSWPKKGEIVEHTLGFTGAPAGCKKVKLRIFDQSLTNWQYDPENSPKPKLFTELTIDLETGKAEGTDTYLADGFEKINMEEYINTDHVPDITGGYMFYSSGIIPYRMLNPDEYGYSNDTDLNGWSHEVNLFSGVEEPDLEVRFYRGDELLGAMSTPAMDQWEKNEYGLYHYTDENGNYMFMGDLASVRETMERMGYPAGPKWSINFRFYVNEPVDPQWTADNDQFTDRIEIVQKSTGEVLADNPIGRQVIGK